MHTQMQTMGIYAAALLLIAIGFGIMGGPAGEALSGRTIYDP